MNAVHFHRAGNWLHRKGVPVAPKLLRNMIFFLYNSYIPPSAEIGKDTIFAYGAIGVVLHSEARIGEGCVIGQGVTIGAAEAFASKTPNKCPRIGNNCYIGAGARILGDITIGNSCQIGAGAVVIRDVPDHSVVAGVPARIVGTTAMEYRAIRP